MIIHYYLLGNASRLCTLDGQWEDKTDYSGCRPLHVPDNSYFNVTEVETADEPPDLEISIVIYLIGKFIFIIVECN